MEDQFKTDVCRNEAKGPDKCLMISAAASHITTSTPDATEQMIHTGNYGPDTASQWEMSDVSTVTCCRLDRFTCEREMKGSLSQSFFFSCARSVHIKAPVYVRVCENPFPNVQTLKVEN